MADVPLRADGPQGDLFAAVVPEVQNVVPEVSDSRLAAWLRPFPNEGAARAALVAAGGSNIRKGGTA